MIKNLITNSSQESDLLRKRNRSHSAAHSSVYHEQSYRCVSTLMGLISLKVK